MNIRYILFTLSLVLVSLSTRAQHFENNYLSIDIPDGWQIQKEELPALDAEIVVFLNTGSEIYNMGMIMGMDKYMDAKAAIDYQPFNDIISGMFQNMATQKSHESKFMGRFAYTKDFEASYNGQKFRGAIYTFDVGNNLIIIIGAYKVGRKSDLPDIWRSVFWKEHDSNARKFSNIREELESLIEVMNSSLEKTPVISNDGEKFMSMRLEENADCVIFKYQLINVDVSTLDDNALEEVRKSIKPMLVTNIKTMSKNITVFKRLMDAQYIFKMEYIDMNEQPIFSLKVVPDDYNQ